MRSHSVASCRGNPEGWSSLVILASLMLLLYVPLSYYTDLFIYRRRQRSKTAKRAG